MSLKIQTALLPQKHIDLSRSIVGLAGFARSCFKRGPHTIDEIWEVAGSKDGGWPFKATPEQITLAILVLFAIGQVKEVSDGKIGICE